MFPGGKGGRCVGMTTLTTFKCQLSWNLGTSTSWNHQGLSRPVMELLYLYFSFYLVSYRKNWKKYHFKRVHSQYNNEYITTMSVYKQVKVQTIQTYANFGSRKKVSSTKPLRKSERVFTWKQAHVQYAYVFSVSVIKHDRCMIMVPCVWVSVW